MEIVTSWERKGRAEGLVEGQITGQRQLVERLLARKLGALPEEVRQALGFLALAQLTALGEALLDFTTLGDLARWLAAPPPPQDDPDPPAVG